MFIVVVMLFAGNYDQVTMNGTTYFITIIWYCITSLLVALSWLLRLPVHRPPSHLLQICPAHLPLLLLAGDEQCDD